MATITQTLVLDDLTGEEGATTLVFGLDGATYEIDLAPSSMEKVRGALEPLVEKARRVDGKSKGRKSSASKPSNSNASKVREWARANGYEVGNRGRIPAEVVAAYEAEQS